MMRAAAMSLLLAWPALAQAPVPAREAQIAPARDARRDAAAQAATAEQAARDAAAARAEEYRLAEARVAAARAAQAAELALARAGAAARQASAAAAAAETERAARAAAIAPLLPLLHRLERWPAESLLAVPAAPGETLRGLLAMQALIRHAVEETEAYRAAAAQAVQSAVAASSEARRLAAVRSEAASADAALEAALEAARVRRAATAAQEDAASRRAREAIARAQDLEQAMARAEREQNRSAASRPPEVPPPPPAARAAMPVPGQVLREFGAPGDGGPARGMTVAAAPAARVVSPCAGRVAFAGAFRTYGRIVIVDCGGGVHVVLARLERLDTATGERVLAGEPVGALPAREPSLYVELRRNGQPADPRALFGGRG